MTAGGFGIAAGLSLAGGQVAPVIAMLVFGTAIVWMARSVAPVDQQSALARVALLAFSLRAATAVVLFTGSVALGRGGVITGDDANYYRLASTVAEYLHGVPQTCGPEAWCGDAYLFGTFVYVEVGLFWLFGPHLLVAELLNAAFGACAVLLIWDLGRSVFGVRGAWVSAIAAAVCPALVLFGGLNLKDSVGTWLVLATVWLLMRLQFDPRWSLLALLLIGLQLNAGVREYIFVVLALIGIFVVIRACIGGPQRKLLLGSVGAASIAALVILNVFTFKGTVGMGNPFAVLENMRIALSQGRTGFGVPGGGAGPSVTEPPGGAAGPSVTRPPGGPGGGGGSVTQPPGGPVGGGGPSATPPPAATPGPSGGPSGPDVLGDYFPPGADSDSVVAVRTITYLPRGLAYEFFAPFPWAARQIQDFLVLPDLLLWYVVFFAAVVGVLSQWRRWLDLTPIIGFPAAMFVLFALVEGNVGTLYRHRATTIEPLAILMAGVGCIWVRERVVRRRARRRPE